jgi:hypothetical protein
VDATATLRSADSALLRGAPGPGRAGPRAVPDRRAGTGLRGDSLQRLLQRRTAFQALASGFEPVPLRSTEPKARVLERRGTSEVVKGTNRLPARRPIAILILDEGLARPLQAAGAVSRSGASAALQAMTWSSSVLSASKL